MRLDRPFYWQGLKNRPIKLGRIGHREGLSYPRSSETAAIRKGIEPALHTFIRTKSVTCPVRNCIREEFSALFLLKERDPCKISLFTPFSSLSHHQRVDPQAKIMSAPCGLRPLSGMDTTGISRMASSLARTSPRSLVRRRKTPSEKVTGHSLHC